MTDTAMLQSSDRISMKWASISGSRVWLGRLVAMSLSGVSALLGTTLAVAAQCDFDKPVGACTATIRAEQAAGAGSGLKLDIVISSSAFCSKVVYGVGGMTETSLLYGKTANETIHASVPIVAFDMKVAACTEYASMGSNEPAQSAAEQKSEDPWLVTGQWTDMFEGDDYGLSSVYDIYETDGAIVGTGFLLWSRRDHKDGKPTRQFISGKRTGKKVTVTTRVPSLYHLDQSLKKKGKRKKGDYSYADSTFAYRMTTPDSFSNKNKTMTYKRTPDPIAGDFAVDGQWRTKDGIRVYSLREKDGLIRGVGSSVGQYPDEEHAAETIDLTISGNRIDRSVELQITDKSGTVATERYTMRNSYSFWDETKPIFIGGQ